MNTFTEKDQMSEVNAKRLHRVQNPLDLLATGKR